MGIATKTGEADIWALDDGRGGIDVILSEPEVRSSDLTAAGLSDVVLRLDMMPADAPIPADIADRTQAIILEVEPDSPGSIRRLEALRATHPAMPIVAAVRSPELATVRTLLRSGVNDVISLPLQASELATVMRDLSDLLEKRNRETMRTGRLISCIKSVGGVGSTTIATQAASLEARLGRESGRQVCLIDLDLQFGNAATYLGATSPLTLNDLLTAGSRVDTALLRTVTVDTASGLHLITAPNDIMPMEAVNAQQIYRIVELAQLEYDTVYLDLPGNWTNWSLSLVARSDIILLVVELSIASLRQARRQISLLHSEGIDPARLHVVANRVEKQLFRPIGLGSAETALDHPVKFSIANDFPLVNSALDQGVLVEELKAKSRVCKDLRILVDACMADGVQGEAG
ncbi:AAA family ATPase [Sphingobium aquiterrae]|uniref:AAA family ATPase n=1 Tax=Sphingobium aquiterrae TaxID=2038656 RepID=UPI003018C7ED